jgi:hypothetical protein
MKNILGKWAFEIGSWKGIIGFEDQPGGGPDSGNCYWAETAGQPRHNGSWSFDIRDASLLTFQFDDEAPGRRRVFSASIPYGPIASFDGTYKNPGWPDGGFKVSVFVGAGAPSTAGAARVEVMAAVRKGLINGAGAAQLLEFDKTGFVSGKDGESAEISGLVFIMLQGLLRGGSFTVMNIARPNDKSTSPHGRLGTDGHRTSFACDISHYNGNQIVLRPDDATDVVPTISAVAGILANLPPGFYKVGFPRPSTALGGPVFPKDDVFLPANTMEDVVRPPHQKMGKDALAFIVNPDAATQIRTALDGNPAAKFSMFFPDGFNHAHLEIISSP